MFFTSRRDAVKASTLSRHVVVSDFASQPQKVQSGSVHALPHLRNGVSFPGKGLPLPRQRRENSGLYTRGDTPQPLELPTADGSAIDAEDQDDDAD
eukprot:3609741-Pleurochrysis_carterae.AAC.1